MRDRGLRDGVASSSTSEDDSRASVPIVPSDRGVLSSATTATKAVESIWVEPTHRCNLRCAMCWYHGEAARLRERKAEAEIEQLVDLYRAAQTSTGASSLVVTGAEALLSEATLALLRHAASRDVHSTLLTNGILLDAATATALCEAGCNAVRVSLDGDEASHDRVRGRGTYSAAVRGLRTLANRARDVGSPLAATLTIVLDDSTRNALEAVVRTASSFGADVNMQHLMWMPPSDAAQHERRLEAELGLRDETASTLPKQPDVDPGVLWERIESARTEARRLGVRLVETPPLGRTEIVAWYRGDGLPGTTCRFVHDALRVSPGGDAMACQFVQWSYGSLAEHQAAALWTSPRRTRFLELAGRLAICGRCCKRGVEPPAKEPA